MKTPAPIPRTRFTTAGMSSEQGWHAWCALFSPLFEVRRGAATDAFRAELDAFDLQRTILTRLRFAGVQQQGIRSRALVRGGGLDQIGIEFCLYNDGYRCEGRDGTKEIQAGDIVVLDLAQESAMVARDSDSITLTVPRSIIEPHCPGIEKLHGSRIGASGQVQLLGDHMLALQRNLPHMTADQANAAMDSTLALVGACLMPGKRLDRAADAIDHTVLDRARQYIAGRLEDPGLSTTTICAAIGTSRSNLYRLFAPVGGVARHIKECRLRRIHAALRDPAEWRSISQLAHTYGFVSAAHCSRAFRELFGSSPREVRNRAWPDADTWEVPVAPDELIGTWLKNLQP